MISGPIIVDHKPTQDVVQEFDDHDHVASPKDNVYKSQDMEVEQDLKEELQRLTAHQQASNNVNKS